jgi:cell division septation protein DedD
MENGLDKKMRDKQIPEEELFEELDAMYQRVADIDKEEAAEVSTQGETALFLEPRTPAAPEGPSMKKPGRNKKRDYRPMILATTAIILVLILAMTFWKPMAVLQLLKIGETPQPAVPPPPRIRKPPSAITTSPPPPPPPVATSPAPPRPPFESFPAQTKQGAAKSPREEAEKAKTRPQEIVKPNKPVPQGKYFAIQIGSFREMENVRDLVGVLKKEGLDAYWITSRSKKRGALYRVFAGQFMDADEAAQFLKDKKILKNYPDSFIQEISSSKIGP